MSFMFEIGKEYETQGGETVKVLDRTVRYPGYETLVCSDGRHRYDRSTHSSDAGRCTGTDFNYSCPHNFKRKDKKLFEFAAQAFTDDPGIAESGIEIDEDGDPI